MRIRVMWFTLLVSLNIGMLAWMASLHSPTMDEVGHLPAGIWTWEQGRFDLYYVNPPLVRTIAALPVMFCRPRTDWNHYVNGLKARPEWKLGEDLVVANGWDCAYWYFVMARWAVIPFSVVGAWTCYRWATELYGGRSGLLAATLWCLCPNVLAWASVITPDAGATALGVAAAYAFWKWLREPIWFRALTAGIVLGLAELTKTTWVVLFALWPMLWLAWGWSGKGWWRNALECQKAVQLAVILLVALYILNLGYGFDGSMQRLDKYTFASRTLAGADALAEGREGGNRFAGTWAGALPMPVPKDYLAGIDIQKTDFELKKWSCLCGEWKHGGWWYYYLFAAALKVPLGTWILGLLAVVLAAAETRSGCSRAEQSESAPPTNEPKPLAGPRGYSAGWRNEIVLLLPALAIMVLVSSQTGFSRYFRYVLPAFPFLYIWTSKVARSWEVGDRFAIWITGFALTWSVSSSLWCFPHSMSYFNELAGGPTRGHRYLIDANIDWGQDYLYLKRWLDAHPEARPLRMAYLSFIHPRHYGIEYKPPPEGPRDGVKYNTEDAASEQVGPRPGWYAMSVHRIYSMNERFDYFLRFRPIAMAGYSIYLYHIGMEEANRVRADLGLPSLASTPESSGERPPIGRDVRPSTKISETPLHPLKSGS